MNFKTMFTFAVLLIGSLVLVSCTTTNDQTKGEPLPLQETTKPPVVESTPSQENPVVSEIPVVSKISLETVSTHNNNEDCWLVVEGKVYNVTSYVSKHPGGEKILLGCGKDATELFNGITKHEPKAKAMLPDFYVGELE